MLHGPGLKILASIMVVGGWSLRMYVRKRQFNRRNAAGLQVFSSYYQSLVTRGWEKFLLISGELCCFFGVVIWLWELL